MENFGDMIQVKLKSGEIYKGVYIPSSDKSIILLKLKSGYNMPILRKNVESVKLLKKHRNLAKKKVRHTPSTKPTVAILHTGGTIASKVDYQTGGVHPLFSTDELYGLFPELEGLVSIKSYHLFDALSEELDFSHFNRIAKEIKMLGSKVKGVIITEGTDTLHYVSSALSFILQGLNIPVVLVGAQRSSDRGSSDAAMNIINAAYFISKTDYAGVGICMHASTNDDECFILRPHNTRKMHTSTRDAFRPINTYPLARVNYKTHKIKYYSYNNYNKMAYGRHLNLMGFNEKIKVGLHYHRPGIQAEEFSFYDKFDGLVIAGTGLGHTSLTPKHQKALKTLTKKIPVVMSSQTVYGRVNLNVYSTGRKELEFGIIPGNQGSTAETTYIKLAWLLSNFPKNKIKEIFHKDFRGEAIPRIIENTFLF